MERYWNWGGKYIGVKQKNYLVACNGTVIGKFYGKEIFDSAGKYIGELGKNDRLVKKTAKDNFRRPAFSTYIKGTITSPVNDCAPYPEIPGLSNFS